MAELGTAFVRVRGDLTDLRAQLVSTLAPTKLNKLAKGAGVAIGAGLIAGGVSKGLFELGEGFDKAFDRIRTGTGATGEDLKALEGDFKDIFKTLPVSMDDTAEAVTGLNQRLGLTGEPLQKLARQILQLSKITDTDIGANVAAVSRLFGDWSVSTERQEEALNRLFRTSQKTGIGVTDLTQLLVKFGAPFRALGLSLDEGAALLGKWEKEGVNLQTTLPGLRMGLRNIIQPSGKAADALEQLGVKTRDPVKALPQIIEAIRGMKDESKASALAMQIFGTRAGPDMARAIIEGRFSIDSLVESIRKGGDTIDEAERQTRDFGEQWELLKHRVFVAIEPVASRFFKTVGDGMEALATADFGKIGANLDLDFNLGDGGADLKELRDSIKETVDSIEEILNSGVARWLGGALLGTFRKQVAALGQTFRGMAQVIAGSLKLISDLLHLRFADAFRDLAQIFRGGVNISVGILRGMTAPVREIAAQIGRALLVPIRGAWEGVRNAFRSGVRGALGVLDGLASGVRSSLGVVVRQAGRLRGIFRPFEGALRFTRRVAEGSFAGIRSAIGFVLDKLRDLIGLAKKAGDALDAGLDFVLPNRAKGGIVKERITLLGEEGWEFVKPPGQKEMGVVGAAGPEVRSLPVGTRVHSHPQSVRMVQKMIPAFAKGGIVRKSLVETFRKRRVNELLREDTERVKGLRLVDAETLTNKRGRTVLVGEEGAELVRLPGGKQTILGQEGPEVRELPVGARVYSHPESVRMVEKMVAPEGKIASLGQKVIQRLFPVITPEPEALTQRVVQTLGTIPGRESPHSFLSEPGESLSAPQALATGGTISRLDVPGVRVRRRRRDEVERDETARRGQEPEPVEASKRREPQAKPSRLKATGRSILSRANKLDRLHLPYVWGGGHGNIGAALQKGFDCSGAVSYVLGIPPKVSGDLAGIGAPGKGPVTVFANQKHTFMSIFGRGFGTGKENPGGGAGWLSYNSRPGFTVSHMPGVSEEDAVGGVEKPKLPKRLSLGQYVTVAKRVGFPDPALAAAVFYAESRGQTNAVGDSGESFGAAQIHWPDHKTYDKKKLRDDVFYNFRAALDISRKGKTFQPWTQYRNASYKQWLRAKAEALPRGTSKTPTGSKYTDYLQMRMYQAEGTPTLKDDIRWINRAMRYWRGVLKRNKRAGNFARVNEAYGELKSLREQKKSLKDPTDQELQEVFELGGLTTIGQGPNAFHIEGMQRVLDGIELEKAQAALTLPANDDDSLGALSASLQDDIAAAGKLVSIRDSLYRLTQGFRMPGQKLQGPFEPTKAQSKRLSQAKSNEERISLIRQWIAEAEQGPWIEGTIKQKIEAANDLATARSDLKQLTDEAGRKEESTEPTETEKKQDFQSFLINISELLKAYGSNIAFKGQLPAFATGGTLKHSLALVGEQGPEIVRLPVGTRVFSNAESERMAEKMSLQRFAQGGVIQPTATGGKDDTAELLRRLIKQLDNKGQGGDKNVVQNNQITYASPKPDPHNLTRSLLFNLESAV